METSAGEDANCDRSPSGDIPSDEVHPCQDKLQPCPAAYFPEDSVGHQLSQDDPTASSTDLPFSMPMVTSSPSHDSHHTKESAADTDDKLTDIKSPPHDIVSETPNSGSDEEDSRLSQPNHDDVDNFSLKLSPEGSDSASTRHSAEPEAVTVMERKCASEVKPLVSKTSEDSQKLDSVGDIVSSCAMAGIGDDEQEEPPAAGHLGSAQGDVSSLHKEGQLSEATSSTKEEAMRADSNAGMEEKPAVAASVSPDKSDVSQGWEQLDKKASSSSSPSFSSSSSSREMKKRLLEPKVSTPARKYTTRKSVASSSSTLLPLRQLTRPPASQPLCEKCVLVQAEGNEEESSKKPLPSSSSLRLTNVDEKKRQQTALLVPSTNSLTIITSTYSMSATFVTDAAPSNTLLTTSRQSELTTAMPTISTPTASMPQSMDKGGYVKRGRGRPRKHPIMQKGGYNREKADSVAAAAVYIDSKIQSSVTGIDGCQTMGDQEDATGEDVYGRDTKKLKMSDPNEEKRAERRRSLRDRVRVPPLLEQSGLFTHRRKRRRSSSGCVLENGPEAGVKSNMDAHPKKASSSQQQVSPTSQTKVLRRNSSRSSMKSPRKKQTGRRSDEGIPVNKNWLCALCSHGNSCHGLGYLYGPYKGKEMSESNADKSSPEKELQNELWVHLDCVVWTPGICLVGSELKGLQQAVEQGKRAICNLCNKPGATISCVQEHCSQRYHLPCLSSKAAEGCRFHQENYNFYCPIHA